MLSITSDGRKAALDLRMHDRSHHEPLASGAPVKLDAVAENVVASWRRHRDTDYLVDHTADSPPHPAPGGFQIVFCDLGTPAGDDWSAYQELKDQCVDAGMDPARIRFVHEANTEEKKARLFAQCRDGGVDVLIGSTEKMGIGTNVQNRLTDLHHIDCPWRPADVEQREGRALRQGNQNTEVAVFRYVTVRSFDAFSWQTVERKARFIDQLMHNDRTLLSAEDISTGQTLGFAEMKAAGSGEPLLLERAEVEATFADLQRKARGHRLDEQQRQTTIRHAGDNIDRHQGAIAQLDQLLERRTVADPWTGRWNDTAVDGRVNLCDAIRRDAQGPIAGVIGAGIIGGDRPIGTARVAGIDYNLDAVRELGDTRVRITFTDAPGIAPIYLGRQDLASDIGIARRLDNRSAGLEGLRTEAAQRLDEAHKAKTAAEARLGEPFPLENELAAAKARLEQIDHELAAKEAAAQAERSTAEVTDQSKDQGKDQGTDEGRDEGNDDRGVIRGESPAAVDTPSSAGRPPLSPVHAAAFPAPTGSGSAAASTDVRRGPPPPSWKTARERLDARRARQSHKGE